MKLGVSLATHNNPVLLRSAFSQLLLQTRLPDCIAVYINGTKGEYSFIIKDLAAYARELGVEVLVKYDGQKVSHPMPHQVPLKMLLDAGMELFTKFDQDDIILTNHLEFLLSLMDNDTDFAGNKLSDVLVNKPGQPIVYTEAMDWYWNPTMCASDCTVFNRRTALSMYLAMVNSPGVPDDVTMATVIAKVRTKLVKMKPTLIYVSHGDNTSGPIDTNYQYIEQIEKRTL